MMTTRRSFGTQMKSKQSSPLVNFYHNHIYFLLLIVQIYRNFSPRVQPINLGAGLHNLRLVVYFEIELVFFEFIHLICDFGSNLAMYTNWLSIALNFNLFSMEKIASRFPLFLIFLTKHSDFGLGFKLQRVLRVFRSMCKTNVSACF